MGQNVRATKTDSKHTYIWQPINWLKLYLQHIILQQRNILRIRLAHMWITAGAGMAQRQKEVPKSADRRDCSRLMAYHIWIIQFKKNTGSSARNRILRILYEWVVRRRDDTFLRDTHWQVCMQYARQNLREPLAPRARGSQFIQVRYKRPAWKVVVRWLFSVRMITSGTLVQGGVVSSWVCTRSTD